jgi:hypothetical protein
MNDNRPQPSFPVLDISTRTKMEQALNIPVEKRYTREELENIHVAIRFTKAFKAEEARVRAEEMEVIQRPLIH